MADVVRIAAIALPAISLQVVFAQTLYARRHIRELALLALLQIAIQLPLSPLLIITLGYRGFAIANATAQVAVALGFFLYVWRLGLAPAPSRVLLTLGRDIIAAAIGAGLVSRLLPQDISGNRFTTLMGLGARAMIAVAVISLVLAALGDPLVQLPLRLIAARVTRPSLK